MEFKVFFEDLQIGETEAFGEYAVSREEIIEFASKYDPQPFHLDEQMAKKTPLGNLCASGWHTGSMTMRMLVDQFMLIGMASVGSPGLDQLRWRKPVFPGDVLKVRGRTLEKRESASRPELGIVKNLWETLNQNDEPVMEMTASIMILKRPITGE